MILYKYYGYDAGLAAILSRKLSFRHPAHFNDPFELTALLNSSSELKRRLREAVEGLKRQVAILSLTRSPFNPLMWAHYGVEHTGFVIGYDVNEKFLTDPDYNLIPVDAGDVIYTKTKSPFDLSEEALAEFRQVKMWSHGSGATLTQQQQNIARRLLLTKHIDWSYEEEVRIVKVADSIFYETQDFQSDPLRSWRLIEWEDDKTGKTHAIQGAHLYDFQVSIKEVYLGVRNKGFPKTFDLKALQLVGSVRKLEVDTSSWQLEVSDEGICMALDEVDESA